MFDVIQISWWLIEATLLGFLCNRKLLPDDTDRILFAPITGFACVLILGNMLWMWSVSTYLMSFVFVIALVLAAIFFVRDKPRPISAVTFWLTGGALLVILHGSLIPFTEKLFQAFPLDRYFYLGASILFEKENLSYFEDAVTRIGYNGDKRAYFFHPLLPMGLNEIKARPASEIAFILFSWATPRDLHRLGNAWEVFIRTLQFSGMFALFWKGLVTSSAKKTLEKHFLSGFLAITIAFGYWFQYTKDFNAWGSATSLALGIATIAFVLLLLNNGKVEPRNRYFVYLLALAAAISYPELGTPFCLALFVLVCANKTLREGFLLRKSALLEGAGFVAAVFAVHPFIVAFMQRQFGLAPHMIGGEESTARGIYRLFEPIGSRIEFVKTIVAQPLRLIADPIALSDMAIGSSGFSYTSYVGSLLMLFIALTILVILLWYFVATTRPHLKVKFAVILTVCYLALLAVLRKRYFSHYYNFSEPASLVFGALIIGLFIWCAIKTTRPNLRILLVLVGFYVFFFIGFLVWGKVGGAYRSLPFWGTFASISLLIFLASSNLKILHTLAVAFGCAHLVFGASIFYVTNTEGIETYPPFYPNATGVRHFELPTVRDKYDFDYTSLIPQLSLCHTVFLDLKYKFHAVTVAMFLENNDIRYRLSIPYRNASPLIGGTFHPGFSKEEVNADCVVEEEVRDGRISYKFVQAKWY